MAEAPVGLGGDEASLWRSRGAGTRRTASSVRVLVTRSPATVEALLGDERAGEGKTRRRGGWLAVVGGSGGDGSKEEDRWWLVGSMDPEGDLVESGGGQEDGWDISLEVRVCPYLD